MYDKSKKTWSQRLKISKNEKSTVAGEQTQGVAGVGTGNGNGIGGIGLTTTQNASQAGSSSTRNMQAMHLQALQMQQQQLNLSEYHASGSGVVVGPPPGYEFLPSALSRSMKYAEPWIYGTVRGIPSRPYHHHQLASVGGYHGHHHPHAAAIFAATAGSHPLASAEHALAVVICSCPEYLNGTKRDVKKASVCKKCKGSRLPLATIAGTGGGTVRLPSAAAALAAGTKLRGAATMRVVSSTKKSRPTILDPQKDPYDLMRRTRLLSPEPGGAPLSAGSGGGAGSSAANDIKSRNRGKSVSPQRGRSRTRTNLPAPKLSSAKKEAPKPPERTIENDDDGWLVEDNESLLSGSLTPQSGHSRRSILRCNVNPYDLISIETPTKSTNLATSTNPSASKSNASSAASTSTSATATAAAAAQIHEFHASDKDEFNVADAALNEDEPPFATNNKNTLTEQERKFYTSNVQAIAGQRISLGDQRATKKSFIKQSTDGRSYESIVIATGVTGEKRKPETIKLKSANNNQQLQKQHQQQQILKKQQQQQQQQQQPKRPPRQTKKTDNGSDNSTLDGALTTTPPSATTTAKTMASETSSDEEETFTVLTVTPTQSIKSILKRPTTLEIGQNLPATAATSTADKVAPIATPTTPLTSASTPLTPATLTPTTKSQFYIPLPQPTPTAAAGATAMPATTPTSTTTTRKKVQFMVEDKIIQASATSQVAATTAATTTTSPTADSSAASSKQTDKSNNYSANDNANALVDANEKSADIVHNDGKVDNNDDEHDHDGDGVTDVRQDDNDSDMDEGHDDQVKYATRGTNYEYYKRKRGQHKLLQQQEQQATKIATVNSNEKSTNCHVEGTDDNADTFAATADELEANSLGGNNSQNATQEINAANADEENKLTATATITTTNIKAESLHYEDVLHPQDSNTTTQQIFNNSESAGAKMSPATTPTATATATTTPSKCAATSMPTTALVTRIVDFVVDDDVDDVAAATAAGDIAERQQQQPTVLHGKDTSTVLSSDQSTTKDGLNRSVYDDIVAKQKLTELLPVERTRKSSANLVQATATTQTPHSRNLVRRAHSERHLSAPSASASYETGKQHELQGSGTNTNNGKSQQNVILNFKDTMALRVKSNRNDSRDLFQRPKEPPPPPPPTPATPTTEPLANAVRPAIATNENIKSTEEMKAPTPQGQQQQVDTAMVMPITTTTASADKQQVVATTNGLDRKQAEVNEGACRTTSQSQRHSIGAKTAEATNEINGVNFDSNAKPGDGLSSHLKHTKSKQQRTVVRVAPFNKTSSEVHRLKISHTDTDVNNRRQLLSPAGHTAHILVDPHGDSDAISADQQKKTSILINGDDCYSTMNLSSDTAQPLYQSSVVVADASNGSVVYEGLSVRTNTSNTVTINVCSPHTPQQQQHQQHQQQRSSEEELIYQHNKINTLLSRQAIVDAGGIGSVKRAIIPIRGSNSSEINLQRSASSTSSTSTSSMASTSSSGSGSGTGSGCVPKRGRTLIRLDYEKEKLQQPQQQQPPSIAVNSNRTSMTTLNSPTAKLVQSPTPTPQPNTCPDLVSHEAELLKILRNPVEAVKHNLVPHVCGRNESAKGNVRSKKMKDSISKVEASPQSSTKPIETNSFIAKLLEDPTLGQVADGLEADTVAELIENSLKRLQTSRQAIDITGTKDNDDMNRLINISLQKIREERQATTALSRPSTTSTPTANANTASTNVGQLLAVPSATSATTPTTKEDDRLSNRGSISSANSFASAHNYEMFDFDANESDCYQSCSSDLTTSGILEERDEEDDDDDSTSFSATRSKFYQMLVDATLAEIEHSTHNDADVDHHYESIRHSGDPIYEEIGDVPPPLPLSAPPLNDPELEKKAARSIFEGASKYDILSYLVDAKERGLVREEAFEYPQNSTNPIIIEEEAADTLSDLDKRKHQQDRCSRASVLSDSSEDNQSTMSSLSPPPHNFMCGGSLGKGAASDIERNDSGVGSETSKTSRSRFQQHSMATIVTNQTAQPLNSNSKNSPLHLCEDCDGAVETQLSDSGVMFVPLVCRKCGKKRVERKEIITEIVETEEKYGRDLQIILEEFCHPMLVAGLLTQEQLSAIFLNTEELLENNQTLAERMRDALDIALEQGDDDLLTVNIGRIFLDFTQMLHAFESYCVRQAGASLLLANLEKEKELLRIFLKVSQMENAVLRRMNLNSFLMVPVQRVTKYPLLLARLYKVTPSHLDGRDLLKQAQEKIELHLNHINQEAKDVPTKLWRRISSSSPNRRASCEIDMINIKLRKMAIDILEWNHDEVRFAMEGKLLYTQPTDSNWKKARTIKLTPVNALLVTNGKPSANYKAEKVMSDKLNFPKHTGIREASLLVVKEKCGRYTLIREPLYLDRCVVCSEADWDDYFEVQEISSKDTFIFKAEDGVRTKQWYTQLQYHAQGMGAWRKRRNALANIMINGMLTRS